MTFFFHVILGIPRLIRADKGTENVVIENIQKAMSTAPKTFIYGKSCLNQVSLLVQTHEKDGVSKMFVFVFASLYFYSW